VPYAELIGSLLAHGYGSIKDFLDEKSLTDLRSEQDRLYQLGLARPAAIGRRDKRQLQPEVRGDDVLWLDPARLTPPQQCYWSAIDDLRRALNEECRLGLREFEAHYARYAPGRGYARHGDVFQDGSRRLVSCVLYLNPNWQASDGGLLRLYLENRTVDILPSAGTLVVFRSQDIEHEVLSARRTRSSLTGWLKTG